MNGTLPDPKLLAIVAHAMAEAGVAKFEHDGVKIELSPVVIAEAAALRAQARGAAAEAEAAKAAKAAGADDEEPAASGEEEYARAIGAARQ